VIDKDSLAVHAPQSAQQVQLQRHDHAVRVLEEHIVLSIDISIDYLAEPTHPATEKKED